MRKARVMGNYAQYLAEQKNISTSDLAVDLNCVPSKISELYKGLVYPTFPQISCLAKKLGVSVQELINGDSDIYDQTVVHCMNDFDHKENREQILDIIEDYIDILNSVSE